MDDFPSTDTRLSVIDFAASLFEQTTPEETAYDYDWIFTVGRILNECSRAFKGLWPAHESEVMKQLEDWRIWYWSKKGPKA